MKDYTEKQINIWEKSTATTYTAEGYKAGTGILGGFTLLSLFCEGFILTGKTADGNQLVKTVAGIELEIHSKSLARALRKKAKRHAWSRTQYITDNRHKMAQMIGIQNGIQWLAVQDADVAIDIDKDTPCETYILIITKEIKHVFRRQTWCSPLEYLGRA